MIHPSEKKPSGLLTVGIAVAGILVLLAANAATTSTSPLAIKSIICVLSILMMNRVGVMTTPTLIATVLFAVLIILENPLIPFQFTPERWTIIRLSGAALFAFAAINSLMTAAAEAKKSRANIDKRNTRVGFR
jgi:hypothetical protein